MDVFLDSASLQDVDACLRRGVIRGITTNPSILAKEPKADFVQHIRKIASLCESHQQRLPLSVEVFTRHPKEMIEQAKRLSGEIGYENLNIKIPIGWDELEVIYSLTRGGIRVNCTCLFTEAQCMLAANAGATYVSIFMGRLKDIGGHPGTVISNTRRLLDQAQQSAKIIVGSIRHEHDITEAQLAGAHIVTAPTALFSKMTVHPQTTKSVDGFLRDFEAWLK